MVKTNFKLVLLHLKIFSFYFISSNYFFFTSHQSFCLLLTLSTVHYHQLLLPLATDYPRLLPSTMVCRHRLLLSTTACCHHYPSPFATTIYQCPPIETQVKIVLVCNILFDEKTSQISFILNQTKSNKKLVP